jgi:hypothetical protein
MALMAGIVGAFALAGLAGADTAPGADTPAAAKPVADPMEAAYANTVKISGKDGDVYVYFNRDGTFTSTGPGGDKFGTWKIVGDKVCTHTKDGGESCGVVQPNRKVGDKWTQDIDGETLQVEIIPGR